MKVNIFKIPSENLKSLIKKFEDQNVDLSLKKNETTNDWECKFYLSDKPEIKEISWVKDYASVLSGREIENKIYFAVYLCKKETNIFAMTYGKAHFYVCNFCDHDFGLEMAKRIGNEKDVKQVASKRFAGRKKKEIKSFTRNTKLDSESGESVDYISSGIIEDKQVLFGKNSKFGSSMTVSREDLKVDNITELLEEVIKTLLENPRFSIPKTEILKNETDIAKYEQELLSKIKQNNETITTTSDSHDMVGVDFVFSGSEKYKFSYNRNESRGFDEITLENLRDFIKEKNIQDNDIFKISIKIEKEDQKIYYKKLKEFIEYTVDSENIVLQNGKWIKFNEEYVNQINDLVDSIEVEQTEKEFNKITTTEPEFNYLVETKEGKKKGYKINQKLIDLKYTGGDKDFSKLEIQGNYKVEAWDLQKEDTVYAVKFGTPQKLVYVCNQAVATLEIIRNNANLKKLTPPAKKYCLWLGFKGKLPSKISEINSIILKQQIDSFARKCREIGIEPVLKFSHKI